MNKNTWLVILSVSVLCLGALAWHQSTEIFRLENQPTPVISVEKDSQTDTITPVAEKRLEVIAIEPEAEKEDPSGAMVSPDRNRRAAILAIKARPEYKQLEQTVIRERLGNEFAGLFYQLRLNPKEREDFLDLLVEKQLIGRDAIALARAQGFNFRNDAEAIRSLINENMKEMDQSIRETFGDSAFEKYENYQKTKSIRSLADSLDRKLSYSSSPLDTVQKERLIELIALAPNQEVPHRGFGLLSPVTMNMARGMLTPSQFTALEEIQAEYLARARMQAMVVEGLKNNTDR